MLSGLEEQGLKRVQLALPTNGSLTTFRNGGLRRGMVVSLYTRPWKGKLQRPHKVVQQETWKVSAYPQTKRPVRHY